jgi:alpha-ketoglutarate-dependent taurine dioxygenase
MGFGVASAATGAETSDQTGPETGHHERLDMRLLEPFGVEIDLDASVPLDDATTDAVRALYREHHLLVVRDQQLDRDQHVAFVRLLGPVPGSDDGMVSTDPEKGMQGTIRLAFHSDLAFAPEPDLGVSLYGLELVDGASVTLFASGVRACQSLPDELRQRLEGLSALHIWPIDQSRRTRLDEIGEGDPRHEHPVICEHPDTGEPILYVTELGTDRIVGLPEEESEALLAELFSRLYDPANVLTHTWRTGDLVVWDNRALQHGRPDVSQVGSRTLRRVAVARQGFFEQFPQFAPSDGFSDPRHVEATPED